MPLVVCNNGEVVSLSYLVGKVTTVENLTYRLFTNNIPPAETDTTAAYTEAAGGGYAPKALTGASWSVSGGSPGEATYAPQTWTFSGPLTGNAVIYGYFVTRSTTGDLILAEAFAPFTPGAAGDTLSVTPRITAD